MLCKFSFSTIVINLDEDLKICVACFLEIWIYVSIGPVQIRMEATVAWRYIAATSYDI